MDPHSDLLRNYMTHAAQALPPVAREAVEQLGLTDQAQIDALGLILAKAYMLGAEAGTAEAVAQAVEQGAVINVNRLTAPEPQGDDTP